MPRSGIMLTAISAASFGCLALFARMALDNGVPKETLLFLRFSAAALIMLGVLKVQGIPLPSLRDVPKMAVLGVVYVGQAICFVSALDHIATSMASLMLYLYPVLVTLLAWAF